MNDPSVARLLPRLVRLAALGSIAVAFALGITADLAASQEQDDAVIEMGRTVYTEQCASCHGQEGKGDGSAARFLDPKPRDFTAQEWQYTDGTIESIATLVTEGIDDSAMTPFADVLSTEQIDAVATYVVTVLVPGGGS